MDLRGSIVLSKLQIGNDEYQILSSSEDIARLKNGEAYEASPQVLTIDLYRNSDKKAVNFSDNYRFYIMDEKNVSLEKYLFFGEKIYENTLYFNVQEFINEIEIAKTKNLIFVFEYVVNNIVLASRGFQLRNGVSNDLAQFSITATAINQSIENTKMSFTEDGLEISNGGFKILDNNEQVFGVKTKSITQSDGTKKDVSMLTLEGAIYAYDGEFTGKIHATEATFDSGEIGGFTISQDNLISTDQNNSIQIYGKTGLIVANNITLGDSAKIKSQIQLGHSGQAFLYNPDEHYGEILRSGQIVIRENGTANFGSLQFNGANSEIKGSTWRLDKDYASFQNVSVSGSIETAVFKTNSVQAAGGTMIFRPSYKSSLKKQDKSYIVILEQPYFGSVGNLVQVVFDGTVKGFFGTVESYTDDILTIDWEGEIPNEEVSSTVLIDYGATTYSPVAHNYPIEGVEYYKEETETKTETETEIETETETEIETEIEIEIKYTKIEDISKLYFQFSDNNFFLSSQDLTFSGDNDYYIKSNNKLLIQKGMLVNSIRKFYTADDDIIIGINSGRTRVGAKDRILPMGLTMAALGDKINMPRLFLGDLKEVGYSGYGLYSDNVHLRGSLTTEIGENSYAGINTTEGYTATIFGENDNSKIVFWAGAEEQSENSVKNASFQVTQNGSVYAARAKLRDSLFAGGTIEATEIRTAELHGRGGTLSIYEESNGIEFKTKENNTIFSITSDGIKANNSNVRFIGDQIRTINDENYLLITTDAGVPALKHVQSQSTCGFYFGNQETDFKIGAQQIQKWGPNGIGVNGNFELKQENCIMQYKKEDGGYNLYVYSLS